MIPTDGGGSNRCFCRQKLLLHIPLSLSSAVTVTLTSHRHHLHPDDDTMSKRIQTKLDFPVRKSPRAVRFDQKEDKVCASHVPVM
jgi:hypothetical protein